ncbi:BCCT transporter [Photobacterium ganghwense]|uniref:BCCT transporter n=1 Tax=Photobacterium ganghwense TaxID=320778 RepID=A0A0J1HCM2_9GAMM|nr:BCCT family transporter [Photobacterium ganghwense]KLV09434.1 BCCT transporter [Photobacterium ganghwense]PSU08587.1 BCCT transporter [Photobacterium ganghwense]QSV15394.1 BCCT family transporter [Photobacterium ganghwense]
MHFNTPKGSDKNVLVLTIGFLGLFLVFSLYDLALVSRLIEASFASATEIFGPLWQWLMVINFGLAVLIAVSRFGKLRMGTAAKPDIGTFRWLAMIMCTLLAGGGVFWSAAEPIYHFMTAPPTFDGVDALSSSAVDAALSQSFLHWGFLAWAALGTLATIVLMHAHHQGGLKLRPRALLYPLVGDKLENHWLGSVIDACSIVAVAAGTIGPIGFLASQLGYSLQEVVGLANDTSTQLSILAVVVAIYSISAFTGMDKGLQWLSRFNVVGAFALLALMLSLGPTDFILAHFGSGFATYLQNFTTLSTNISSPGWNQWWTWFFWGWFIGFAPMMAIFIARISEGRTVRELVMTVAIIAPVVTNFWFTVLGGTGISIELSSPGSISGPLTESGLPAVLLATLAQLPFSDWIIPAFLVLTTTFVVTTGDSMAYSIAMVVSGDSQPSKAQRLFWAVTMGVIAAVLLLAGDGGLNALQSFIVITAVPVSLLVAVSLITGPLTLLAMQETDRQSPKQSVQIVSSVR